MFPWAMLSSLADSTPPPLAPRAPEEMVRETLMLELSSLLKHCERLGQEKALERHRCRRRSSVDYSWLASPPRLAYQLSPGELLELEELCGRIPPPQCGPVILRFRKLVTEFEPEVQEVSRLFRSVLRDSLEEEEEEGGHERSQWDKRRSQSLSLVSFRSRLRINPFKSGGAGTLAEDPLWGDEEEAGPGPVGGARRVRSMPEIMPTEARAPPSC
ncbi:protein RD3 [Amia ocellicauda]|uniref:protein RD3 n=1 Tax=Amia ocellicauda TaxID=2972642 RepID=UPI0034644222